MASRRNLPPAYEDRFSQAAGLMRRGLAPAPVPLESLPPAAIENRLASQAAEIQTLAEDNHKLATSHLALRRDLVAAQQEAEKLREHIRSLRTEGDIQIRILLDRITKMEADISAAENLRKELKDTHLEAQSLVASRIELSARIQQATQELDNARSDVKRLPDMHIELDTLRQEHQRLRKTFEHEKGLNVDKVEQLKNSEKDLISMTEEVERLRSEVSNAGKRATAPIPHGGLYTNSSNVYPPPAHGNGVYMDGFHGSHLQTVTGARPEGPSMYHPGGGFAFGPPVINGPTMGAGGFPVGPPLMNGMTIGGGFLYGPPVMNHPPVGGGGGYQVGPPLMNGPPVGGGGFAVGPPVMNGPPVGAGAPPAGNPAWARAYEALHAQR